MVNGKMECRFKFPRIISMETLVEFKKLISKKNHGLYTIKINPKRRRGNEFVN
jgi:hypothetical protein